MSEACDYNSHNAELLEANGMMNLLLKLDCVQDALKNKAGAGLKKILITGGGGHPGRKSGGPPGLERKDCDTRILDQDYSLDTLKSSTLEADITSFHLAGVNRPQNPGGI